MPETTGAVDVTPPPGGAVATDVVDMVDVVDVIDEELITGVFEVELADVYEGVAPTGALEELAVVDVGAGEMGGEELLEQDVKASITAAMHTTIRAFTSKPPTSRVCRHSTSKLPVAPR